MTGMATTREKIVGTSGWHPNYRRFLKRQMNRFIRRDGKNVDEDAHGCKSGRKPTRGWET